MDLWIHFVIYHQYPSDMMNLSDEYYKSNISQNNNIPIKLQIFEKLCNNIERENTIHDIILENKFIKLIDRIHDKYPLLYMPTFIDDLIDGVFSNVLVRKYDLNSMVELEYIKTNMLKLNGVRDKSSCAKINNLKKKNWKSIYDNLNYYMNKYNDGLKMMYYNNLLISLIIFQLFLNGGKINYGMLFSNIKSILMKNIALLPIYKNKQMVQDFTQHVENLNCDGFNKIIAELDDLGHVCYHVNENVQLVNPVNKVFDDILIILYETKNGLAYYQLYKKLINKNLILKLIPSIMLIDSMIIELEESNKLISKKGFSYGRPYTDHLFLKTNYDVLTSSITSFPHRKFYGRSINKITFISELLKLHIGDFEDDDDQVTRISGLFLADASILKVPHEDHDQFDFAVELSKYDKQSSISNMLKKINIATSCNLLHIKVMINEKLTDDVFNKLLIQLPKNDHLLIFTFCDISLKIENKILGHDNIDIMNKCMFESCLNNIITIPCRLGSLARIKYGDYAGKHARVDSINYESALASVMIIPEIDVTVPIDALEEINAKCPHFDNV